ncbi:death domain-containing protein CRADD [Spea bombifrons]|uniref:death domain-containing protein CRADD n=1 Tax=Spea bombifrons TaxID=233779 RepID=UPI00234A544C|nr:death domain-containing protein CRADD [Spea bombifrons]XP_053328447.1 death domain-containing protein CRADD [Spea bombifrons]
MDQKHKVLLTKLRLELCAEALADGLVPQYLFQELIITSDQLEQICTQTTSQRRTMKLLDILQTRGPNAFKVFLESLSEFPWVRERIEGLCKENLDQFTTRSLELPEMLRHSCPTDKQLNILAGKLGSEWEHILIHLGLDHNQLYRCKSQYPYSVHSQAFEGFIKWKQQMGSKATMQSLWEALNQTGADPSVMQYIMQ